MPEVLYKLLIKRPADEPIVLLPEPGGITVGLQIVLGYEQDFPAHSLNDEIIVRQQIMLPPGQLPTPRPPTHGKFNRESLKATLVGGCRVDLEFEIPDVRTTIQFLVDRRQYDTWSMRVEEKRHSYVVVLVPRASLQDIFDRIPLPEAPLDS